MNYQEKVNELNEQAQDMTAGQIIRLSSKEFGQRLVDRKSVV